MTPEQRRHVEELFQRLAGLPKEAAETVLDKLCGGDAEVKGEVARLLSADAAGDPRGEVTALRAAWSEAAATRGEPAPGKHVGPYKLLSVLGEGGFGVVYLAERREPFVQRVALKIIKPGMDSRAVIARFEQERQALAMMDHPNVAKVVDGGVTPPELGGRPFFVMELVQGSPITAYCDQNRLTLRERLELFIPVCEAIQHAHHKGIIHRDIKPSNILVEVADGRGIPKVIDFGVAKAVSHTLTEKTIFTEQGQLIGTPEYMSPEQAEMGPTSIDTRTDLYSLGVVLYELLTGALPFDRESLRACAWAKIVEIIRDVDPPRPSTKLSSLGEAATGIAEHRKLMGSQTLMRALKDELDWITLKAMEKDRARRYSTAAEFASDIRNYLAGHMVIARPPTASYRTRKFLRRNRALVSTATAVGLALLIGLAASLSQLRRALVAERDARGKEARAVTGESKAVEAEGKARASEALAKRNAYEANIAAAASAMMASDNVSPALKRLDGCDPALRGWEWHRLRHAADSSVARTDLAEPTLWQARFTPDGSGIVVCSAYGVSTLGLDLKKRDDWRYTRGRDDCTSALGAEVSRDGRRVLSISKCGDGPARTVLFERGKEPHTFEVGPAVNGWIGPLRPRLSADGSTIVVPVRSENGVELVWHDAAVPAGRWQAPRGARALTVNANGSMCCIISGTSEEGVVGVYSRDGQLLWRTAVPQGLSQVHGVAMTPDGSSVAVAGPAGIAIVGSDAGRVWAVSTKRDSGGVQPSCAAISADGRRVAFGANVILVLRDRTVPDHSSLLGHASPISSADFSADGSRVVTSGFQHELCVWDVRPNSFELPGSGTFAARGSDNHPSFIIGGASPDRSSIQVAMEGGGASPMRTPGSAAVIAAACSDSGKSVASITPESLILRSAVTAKASSILRLVDLGLPGVGEQDLGPIAFVPRSADRVIITVKEAGGKTLLSVVDSARKTAERAGELAMLDDDGPGKSVFVSPPSNHGIAFVTYTGLFIWPADGPPRTVTRNIWPGELCFDPSGKRLAVVSHDRKLSIYDTQAFKLLESETAHQGDGLAVTWISDDRIATGGTDGSIIVWATSPLRALMTEPRLVPTSSQPVIGLTFDRTTQTLWAALRNSKMLHAFGTARGRDSQ